MSNKKILSYQNQIFIMKKINQAREIKIIHPLIEIEKTLINNQNHKKRTGPKKSLSIYYLYKKVTKLDSHKYQREYMKLKKKVMLINLIKSIKKKYLLTIKMMNISNKMQNRVLTKLDCNNNQMRC